MIILLIKFQPIIILTKNIGNFIPNLILPIDKLTKKLPRNIIEKYHKCIENAEL